MPFASRLFLRVTVIVCCLAAATLFLPGGGEAGAGVTNALPPDLKTRRPNDVMLERGSGVDLLRFSNEIVNRGRGPLEMRPEGDCDDNPSTSDRKAFQRVFQDNNENGVFDRGPDTAVETSAGCTRFHAQHSHWHFDDFALYELIEIDDDGSLGEVVASSEKVGFCLVDTNHLKPQLAGSPADRHYAGACTQNEATGISVGWSDVYGWDLYHQWIVITGVPNGRYCLRSEADPDNKIVETRNGNNASSIAIRLRTDGVRYKPRRACP